MARIIPSPYIAVRLPALASRSPIIMRGLAILFNSLSSTRRQIWSAGALELKIDNVMALSVTGVNTQNSANAWVDAVDLEPQAPGGAIANVNVTIDDLRYNDTTSDSGASANNTWMGDQSVRTANATGNDAVQWTPLSGANWQNVASATFDGDTAYNYSSTATQQDTYDFGALQNTITTIAAVQITYAARKGDDAGSRSVKSVIKISGTSYFGNTYSMPSTYAYFTDLWVIQSGNVTELDAKRCEWRGLWH